VSGDGREPELHDAPDEVPSFDPAKVREARPRDLVIRFFAGGLTSVVAGLVAIAFGAKVGGALLAFPAILAASLTLIEQQEDSAEAREDARGAIAGGIGLTAFADVAYLLLGHVPGAAALALATAAWAAVAMGIYFGLWRRHSRR
jgi:uncharacterized membrane protein (GlpM family)